MLADVNTPSEVLELIMIAMRKLLLDRQRMSEKFNFQPPTYSPRYHGWVFDQNAYLNITRSKMYDSMEHTSNSYSKLSYMSDLRRSCQQLSIDERQWLEYFEHNEVCYGPMTTHPLAPLHEGTWQPDPEGPVYNKYRMPCCNFCFSDTTNFVQ